MNDTSAYFAGFFLGKRFIKACWMYRVRVSMYGSFFGKKFMKGHVGFMNRGMLDL